MRDDISSAVSALSARNKPILKVPGPMKKCLKTLESSTSPGSVQQIAVVFDPPPSFRESAALGAAQAWKEIQPYLLGQTADSLYAIRASGAFGKPDVFTIPRGTISGVDTNTRRTVGQLGGKEHVLFVRTTRGTAVWKFSAESDRDQFASGLQG